MSKTPKLPKKKRVVPPGSRKGIGGQPTKYRPEYCHGIVKWFQEFEGGVPFLSAYARSIGIGQQSLHDWSAKHPEFSEAMKKAKDIQVEKLVNQTIKPGGWTPAMSIFTLKNIAGWRDKTDIDIEGNLSIEIVNYGKKS